MEVTALEAAVPSDEHQHSGGSRGRGGHAEQIAGQEVSMNSQVGALRGGVLPLQMSHSRQAPHVAASQVPARPLKMYKKVNNFHINKKREPGLRVLTDGPRGPGQARLPPERFPAAHPTPWGPRLAPRGSCGSLVPQNWSDRDHCTSREALWPSLPRTPRLPVPSQKRSPSMTSPRVPWTGWRPACPARRSCSCSSSSSEAGSGGGGWT